MENYHKKQLSTAKIAEIKDFIHFNLRAKLTLDTLSEKFNYSAWTFKRQFQYCFKQSLRDYILECRMQQAVKLLTEGITTINEIAYAVGYKNRSSFTHAFSSYYGYPPIMFLESGKRKVVLK